MEGEGWGVCVYKCRLVLFLECHLLFFFLSRPGLQLTKQAGLANYAATGSTCLYLLRAGILLGMELGFQWLDGKHFKG